MTIGQETLTCRDVQRRFGSFLRLQVALVDCLRYSLVLSLEFWPAYKKERFNQCYFIIKSVGSGSSFICWSPNRFVMDSPVPVPSLERSTKRRREHFDSESQSASGTGDFPDQKPASPKIPRGLKGFFPLPRRRGYCINLNRLSPEYRRRP